MQCRYSFAISMLMVLSATVIACAQEADKTSPPVLPRAHSHNDYYQSRPLLDALDQGFCSVEADVFLVDGELLVGHEKGEVRPERSLEALYLKPLAERVKRNGGHVHAEPSKFMLLVDFKGDGAASFAALEGVLEKYSAMLSKTVDGKFQPGAVEVVVSGDRPWEAMAAKKTRFSRVDGRVADLYDFAKSTAPADLMPLVSDSWFTKFRWAGNRPMPEEERKSLRSIVEIAHKQGRRVRFWAAPESEEVWQELQAAGVDHINTDQLDRLRRFFESGKRPGEQP